MKNSEKSKICIVASILSSAALLVSYFVFDGEMMSFFLVLSIVSYLLNKGYKNDSKLLNEYGKHELDI